MCLRGGVEDNKINEEGNAKEVNPPVKKADQPPKREINNDVNERDNR